MYFLIDREDGKEVAENAESPNEESKLILNISVILYLEEMSYDGKLMTREFEILQDKQKKRFQEAERNFLDMTKEFQKDIEITNAGYVQDKEMIKKTIKKEYKS